MWVFGQLKQVSSRGTGSTPRRIDYSPMMLEKTQAPVLHKARDGREAPRKTTNESWMLRNESVPLQEMPRTLR
jgi:hypothetical protein